MHIASLPQTWCAPDFQNSMFLCHVTFYCHMFIFLLSADQKFTVIQNIMSSWSQGHLWHWGASSSTCSCLPTCADEEQCLSLPLPSPSKLATFQLPRRLLYTLIWISLSDEFLLPLFCCTHKLDIKMLMFTNTNMSEISRNHILCTKFFWEMFSVVENWKIGYWDKTITFVYI